MTRTLTLAALLALPAAASAGTYTATPSSAADGRVITRTASWTCGGAACTATSSASRPLVLCQGLAKKVGALSAFTADGRALAAEELAKCNAMARGSAADAPATLARN